MSIVLYYLFLELGIFADFVELIWGRDDSPARHDGTDHLQSAHHHRMRPHAITKLIPPQKKEKVQRSSEDITEPSGDISSFVLRILGQFDMLIKSRSGP